MENLIDQKIGALEKVDTVSLAAMKIAYVHITASTKRYCVPQYLSEEEIRKLYDYNLQYAPNHAALVERCDQEKRLFNADKLLTRAFQFAKGEQKTKLETER